MDSLITAAARALAAGDPLGALKRVALRDDAPALALRGIAMAQHGDLARAKALLRSAARAFDGKRMIFGGFEVLVEKWGDSRPWPPRPFSHACWACPPRWRPFEVVTTDNGVNIDFMDKDRTQHYAFSEQRQRKGARIADSDRFRSRDPDRSRRGENTYRGAHLGRVMPAEQAWLRGVGGAVSAV
jgi:hypothetical protein